MAASGPLDGEAHQAVSDLEGFREACDLLLSRARRTLRVLAPQLDLALLNREAVASELARLARTSRFTEIRVLFSDSLLAVQHGHRLIELGRRFPSFISLRQLPADARDQESAWMVVDESGLLWRASHRRYGDGRLALEDTRQAPKLCREFDGWWERALPDPELRQLFL